MTDVYTGPDRRQTITLPLGFPWWVLPGLAFFALVAFAAVAAASFMANDATLRTQTANTWSNIAIAVVAYWFGSSAGSAKKDEALAATSIKQNETIAAQGAALATSAPAPVVTTVTNDPGPPPTTTVKTEPAEPQPKAETPLP